MPIMYEPQTGMPVDVPDVRINDFLGQGYRFNHPHTVKTEIPEEINSTNDKSPKPIDVNSATLKELTELFGLSTAQAKELRDGRPYKTIEDLIAKLPDIDWVNLAPRISFE